MEIKLKTDVYSLEAIINTCYLYLDKVYLYLDTHIDKEIIICFKSKDKNSTIPLSKIKSEFLNDLIYYTVRYIVNKNNKKITEYIVHRAIYSASTVEKGQYIYNLRETDDKKFGSVVNDPLGIAIPWEEKYGKKRKNARNKV